MDYTQLFHFRFVDRDKARFTFQEYLHSISSEVLWIDGLPSVGKTTLVDFELDQHPQYAYCYLDINKYETEQEIISAFIEKLQEKSKRQFLRSIKKFFVGFYQSETGEITQLTSSQFPHITSIVSFLLSFGCYALTYKEEHTDSKELVVKYIEEIFKNQPLFICIDNYSKLSSRACDFFSYVFKRCINNNRFKSCIITNSEDENWINIKRRIITEFPHIAIHLSGLDKAEDFYHILHLIFNMDNFREQEIMLLFDRCKGSPGALSNVIYKLIERNGIIRHEGRKPKINRKVLDLILNDCSTCITDADFTSIERWVVFTVFSIGKQANIDRIEDLFDFIISEIRLFSGIKIDILGETLLGLIDKNILTVNGDVVAAKNASIYSSIKKMYENSPIKTVFSSTVIKYYYLHTGAPESLNQAAYHTFLIRYPKWEIINYEYGQRLYLQGQIDAAAEIFDRLAFSGRNLTSTQLLCIGRCFYETGRFTSAVEQLKMINPGDLTNESEKADYYISIAKSYNTTGNVCCACSMLEIGISSITVGSIKYAEMLNLLQMYYCEIPEKENKAVNYFNEVRYGYKNQYPILWANTMRGCQNYVSDYEAICILNEAHNLLIDPLEAAFVDNTLGYINIRMGQFEKAKNLFHIASDAILKLKPHEYSYAANNLAACYLMKGDIYLAKKVLLKALLWNSTVYGAVVIKTHLMIATAYNNESEECKNYAQDLLMYLEQNCPKDRTILRKIHFNLAVVGRLFGNEEFMKEHIQHAYKSASGTTTEHRCDNFIAGLCSNSQKYSETTKFDPWFLIYAHD